MDIANTLTLTRLPLAGLMWKSASKSRNATLVITAAAGITDILDGWAARRFRPHKTSTGAWLDPLCDKVFVLSALGAVSSSRKLPLFLPFLVATREILQLSLVSNCLKSQEIDVKAAPIGKITTAAQFLAIGSMLFRPRLTFPLAILAGALGFGAALYYSRTLLQ